MKDRPKIGIIGCGQVAASHLRGYEQNGVRPEAFADLSAERAQTFSAKVPGSRAYGSYLELLEKGGVEAISICTPPGLHREITVAALARGIHVLCEKPLAGTLEDCVAIEEAVAGAEAVFMMAFRHRFLPAHQLMKSMLEEKATGKVVLYQNIFGGPATEMANSWFCQQAVSGGGVLLDTSTHGLDLFRFFCGEVQVSAGQARRTFVGTDVEDTGTLLVRSQSGALGAIASSWNIGGWVASVDLHAENVRLSYDYSSPKEVVVTRKGAEAVERIAVEASDGFREQIEHFLFSISAGRQPTSGVLDGRRAVEVISGVYSY